MLYRLIFHYSPNERLILENIGEQQKNSVLRDWNDPVQSTLYLWQMSKVGTYRKAMIKQLDIEEMAHVDIP